MVHAHAKYVAAGGNRHPAAADWDLETGILAYGSDRNVALWKPVDEQLNGVTALLNGHTDDVTVVKFFSPAEGWPNLLLSGSADRTIRLWQNDPISDNVHITVGVLEGHASSINCIDTVHERQVLASGSADATIKIWKLDFVNNRCEIRLLQTIQTRPKCLPLTIALAAFGPDDLLLAAAGTKADIYIYAGSIGSVNHQATLSGHEGWIRSLAITAGQNQQGGDFLLASASQDKYIRLWRFCLSPGSTRNKNEDVNRSVDYESLLSNKTHKLETPTISCSITFEALLLGHDDWIYTVQWKQSAGGLRLLSASADSSLAIWDHDEGSGVWLCTTRLGEISALKGSTTATGSTGGFWVGLWSPDGQSVVSLSRTGSWRVWNYDGDLQRWMQGLGVSGHTRSVLDIAWAKNGSYLLSTGSDQTTRLHAQRIDGQHGSWREFGRPQIHGYVLNCIDTIGELQFVSGADEKLLRVFDEPKATAQLLQRFCGIKHIPECELPLAANVPVLGLSNKAVVGVEDIPPQVPGSDETVPQDQSHPPLEDDLARHTLWPESEKLYGHGYEISAVAASHDGRIVATACKASSLNYAVIRLFETEGWRERKPPLTAHSLTVTALRFTNDDGYLLSTGRDRQWAVFRRDDVDDEMFRLEAKNPKAHSRMILSACWASCAVGRIFVTAGRDKTCKFWDLHESGGQPVSTIIVSAPVTAVDVLPLAAQGMLALAVATESGDVTIYGVDQAAWAVKSCHRLQAS
ncbi:MAG: hypothetical protein LQ346_000597 [Caloplaca aetnensis]|nr:MAG: hypothetical protein LQ346_000597 [Caloplaca aetnensis]